MADEKIAVRSGTVPDYIKEELGDEEYKNALRDNVEGTRRAIPSIKIKGGIFTMPNSQKVEKFEGVIVHRGRARAYFPDKNTPMPKCYSIDGKIGSLPRQESKFGDCPSCSLSKVEKKEDGSYVGALCPEKDRMMVLVGDAIMPWVLNAPPTSLREVDDYMSILTACGIPHFAIRTEFKLLTQKRGGNEWDKLVLSRSDSSMLTKEEFKKVNALRLKIGERLRVAPPVPEEHAENDAPGTPGATPVDENF